ncbi:Dehydrogenase/reductase SDR family member 4 [Lamellibrachia satsuma]|nr:Dehydrogenase/reductase SDR family member 4 [Lamellibrachia satsuma]
MPRLLVRIGLAIAERLGRDGAHVVVSSRKKKNVDAAVHRLKAQKLSVSGIVCHVGDGDARKNLVEQTVKEQGGVDILVSNAGINPAFGPILDTSDSAWDKILAINVKVGCLLAKEVVPHMKIRGGGSIVFVSSIVSYVPSQFLGAYSVSKTALLGLTKVLAEECAPEGIRVNCLAPGFIKTSFSSALWKNEQLNKDLINSIPMKRLGEPEECAGTVSFLVSDDARYITGETIVVSGGMTSRL